MRESIPVLTTIDAITSYFTQLNFTSIRRLVLYYNYIYKYYLFIVGRAAPVQLSWTVDVATCIRLCLD